MPALLSTGQFSSNLLNERDGMPRYFIHHFTMKCIIELKNANSKLLIFADQFEVHIVFLVEVQRQTSNHQASI